MWENGRQLKYLMMGTSYVQFEYNDQGIRTGKKSSNGIEYKYIVDGTRIVAQLWWGEVLIFIYDANGSVIGMKSRYEEYDEGVFDTYWFEKNLQGDIIAVYNEEGTKLVEYTYDAWGNFRTEYFNGGDKDFAVSYNPFRYRGYYYDKETGFYYLNSRYYDPQTGRFLNADSILSQKSLIGNNMYAYCFNNPVNMADTTGELPFFIVTAAIGAVAGAIIGGVVAAKNGGNVWAGIGIGTAAGALIGTGVGMAAGAALAGSIAAPTGAVIAGGGVLVSTIATGGIGAGVTYVSNNLSQAGNEISNVVTNTMQHITHKNFSNPGKPFIPGKTGFQMGVDPNTLIPQKNLANLDPQRMANAIKYGGDHAVIVNLTGIIQDGHHRVADAIINGRAIDIFVEPFK